MSEAFMRRYYETYNSEDPESLAKCYHPQVELRSPEGVMRGREELLATYRYLIDTFEDRMTPTRIVVDGDTVRVDITDTLTARAAVPEFMGVSLAAGECLTLELRGTYRFEDGRLRHILIEPRA